MKVLITIEPHGIVWSNFAYVRMSTLSNHWHVKQHILMNEALLSISPAGRGELVKMPITLEPQGIFGPNFAYFNIV